MKRAMICVIYDDMTEDRHLIGEFAEITKEVEKILKKAFKHFLKEAPAWNMDGRRYCMDVFAPVYDDEGLMMEYSRKWEAEQLY